MYAVIETGGKQYRVEVGTELQVELLDVEPGKTITLDRVLLVADGDTSSIGQPARRRRRGQRRGRPPDPRREADLVQVPPKARSRVKKGHRQELTVLRISDITLDGKSAAKSAKKAEDDAKTERQRLEEAAAAQAAKDAELAAKLAAGAEAPPKAKATAKAKRRGQRASRDQAARSRARRRPSRRGQDRRQAKASAAAKAAAKRRPRRQPRPPPAKPRPAPKTDRAEAEPLEGLEPTLPPRRTPRSAPAPPKKDE